MSAPAPAQAVEIAAEEPGIIDTYSLTYALILLFLLPGVAAMSRLPFGDARSSTYTLSYVSAVTVPFLLAVIATLLLTSGDGVKRALLRVAVLTPLIVMTGVTLMFSASFVMVVFSRTTGIRDQGLLSAWWIGLAVVIAPLAISLVARLRAARTADASAWIQLAAIAAAAVFVAVAAYYSLVGGVAFQDVCVRT